MGRLLWASGENGQKWYITKEIIDKTTMSVFMWALRNRIIIVIVPVTITQVQLCVCCEACHDDLMIWWILWICYFYQHYNAVQYNTRSCTTATAENICQSLNTPRYPNLWVSYREISLFEKLLYKFEITSTLSVDKHFFHRFHTFGPKDIELRCVFLRFGLFNIRLLSDYSVSISVIYSTSHQICKFSHFLFCCWLVPVKCISILHRSFLP